MDGEKSSGCTEPSESDCSGTFDNVREQPVTDSQRILDSIRRLVRLLRLSDRVAQRELGLSAAQLFVLQELGKTPALSLSEVAERTRTDQSSVSVVVTRLVGSGHIA